MIHHPLRNAFPLRQMVFRFSEVGVGGGGGVILLENARSVHRYIQMHVRYTGTYKSQFLVYRAKPLASSENCKDLPSILKFHFVALKLTL